MLLPHPLTNLRQGHKARSDNLVFATFFIHAHEAYRIAHRINLNVKIFVPFNKLVGIALLQASCVIEFPAIFNGDKRATLSEE
jgi:enolase